MHRNPVEDARYTTKVITPQFEIVLQLYYYFHVDLDTFHVF